MDKKTILCIEDSNEDAEFIEHVVKQLGIDVDCIDVVEDEGQIMAQQINPNLILINLRESDTDGWGVFKKIKAVDRVKNIPIILINRLDSRRLGDAPNIVLSRIRPWPDALLKRLISIRDLTATIHRLMPTSHDNSQDR